MEKKDVENVEEIEKTTDIEDEKLEGNKEKSKQTKAERKKKLKEEKKKFKQRVGSFFSDFKKFISKGNIIDLSVAVVIGAAFNKIVSSLVNNIIMPLISTATGGVSVADWKWIIKPATYDELGNVLTAETALSYGIFIQAIIDFLIIAFTIFIILKLIVNSQRGVKRFGKKIKEDIMLMEGEPIAEEVVPAPVKIESQEDILKDIRTLLQQQAQSKPVTDNVEKLEDINNNV